MNACVDRGGLCVCVCKQCDMCQCEKCIHVESHRAKEKCKKEQCEGDKATLIK